MKYKHMAEKPAECMASARVVRANSNRNLTLNTTLTQLYPGSNSLGKEGGRAIGQALTLNTDHTHAIPFVGNFVWGVCMAGDRKGA